MNDLKVKILSESSPSVRDILVSDIIHSAIYWCIPSSGLYKTYHLNWIFPSISLLKLFYKIVLFYIYIYIYITLYCIRDKLPTPVFLGFPGGSDGKESTSNARDLGSMPGLERYPGEGHGNPLQYSCLENPHAQRSLVGYSPMGHKESGVTEHTQHI